MQNNYNYLVVSLLIQILTHNTKGKGKIWLFDMD